MRKEQEEKIPLVPSEPQRHSLSMFPLRSCCRKHKKEEEKKMRAHGGVYVRGPQERARWPGCRNMALGGDSPSMSGNRSSFYGSCVQE